MYYSHVYMLWDALQITVNMINVVYVVVITNCSIVLLHYFNNKYFNGN